MQKNGLTMKESNHIELNEAKWDGWVDSLDKKGAQKTLLLPLWGRAVETLKKEPLLVDNTAVKIVEQSL